MDKGFDGVYARTGWPSVPPERLLKAMLLQILSPFAANVCWSRASTTTCRIDGLWGLSVDEPVWDHSTFSQNRDRLLNEGLPRVFFAQVKALADWLRLTSSDHFSVDGTLIDAWVSHKSFRPKGGEGAAGPARLFKKAEGTASRLCHMSTC